MNAEVKQQLDAIIEREWQNSIPPQEFARAIELGQSAGMTKYQLEEYWMAKYLELNSRFAEQRKAS